MVVQRLDPAFVQFLALFQLALVHVTFLKGLVVVDYGTILGPVR